MDNNRVYVFSLKTPNHRKEIANVSQMTIRDCQCHSTIWPLFILYKRNFHISLSTDDTYNKYASAISWWAIKEICQCLVCIIVIHNQGFINTVWWKSHFMQKGVSLDKFLNLQMNNTFGQKNKLISKDNNTSACYAVTGNAA